MTLSTKSLVHASTRKVLDFHFDRQTDIEVSKVMQHWIISLALYYFIHSLTLLQFSKLVKSLYANHIVDTRFRPYLCAAFMNFIPVYSVSHILSSERIFVFVAFAAMLFGYWPIILSFTHSKELSGGFSIRCYVFSKELVVVETYFGATKTSEM